MDSGVYYCSRNMAFDVRVTPFSFQLCPPALSVCPSLDPPFKTFLRPTPDDMPHSQAVLHIYKDFVLNRCPVQRR